MKRWQLWLGFLISAVFVFLALRGLDFAKIGDALKSANYFWIIPAVLTYFAGLWLRTIRWKIFLKPIKHLNSGYLFSVTTIGYMGNNIYPARMGELVRAYVLKKDHQIAITASLATIIIERIFDGIVMLGFILLNLATISEMTNNSQIKEMINTVSLWGAVIFLVAFVVFLLAAIFPENVSGLLKRAVRRIFNEKTSENIGMVIEKFFTRFGNAFFTAQHFLCAFYNSNYLAD